MTNSPIQASMSRVTDVISSQLRILRRGLDRAGSSEEVGANQPLCPRGPPSGIPLGKRRCYGLEVGLIVPRRRRGGQGKIPPVRLAFYPQPDLGFRVVRSCEATGSDSRLPGSFGLPSAASVRRRSCTARRGGRPGWSGRRSNTRSRTEPAAADGR